MEEEKVAKSEGVNPGPSGKAKIQMRRTKRLKFYLVGPVQYVEDHYTWREEVSSFLETLGHEALMPWGQMYHSKAMGEEYERWAGELKPEEFFARVRKDIRKKILSFDLNQVLKADGLIFYLPKGIQTYGSSGEITLAYYLKKWGNGKKRFYEGRRIFLITDIPLKDTPRWLVGCSDYVFTSLEEFREFFKENLDRKNRGGKENGL